MSSMLTDRNREVGDAEVGEGNQVFPIGVPPKWSY